MNEIECLEQFVENSDWLYNSKFFQHIQKHGFSSNYLPDEESLRSFLLTFRSFVSNDEPIHLHKIYNLLETSLFDDSLKSELRKSRQHLKEMRQSVGIDISKKAVSWKRDSLPEIIISDSNSFRRDEFHTAEDILNLWINSKYFHNNQDKRKELKRISSGFGGVISKMVMLQLIYETTLCIFHVAEVIRTALQDKKFDFMAANSPKA